MTEAPQPAAADEAVAEISVEELRGRIGRGERPVVVDVRENDEVAAGMIPGARHLRLAELPDRLPELASIDEVIFVCRGGGRSARACRILQAEGRGNGVSLTGGMQAWNGHG
jgi:rhodanese-related sulfurtransferase